MYQQFLITNEKQELHVSLQRGFRSPIKSRRPSSSKLKETFDIYQSVDSAFLNKEDAVSVSQGWLG